MRIAPTVAVLLTTALLPISTDAQQASPGAPQRDPQALAVLALCSTAMGVIGSNDTFFATGQIVRADPDATTGTIVLKSVGYDRARREITYPQGQQITIRNRLRGSGNYSGRLEKFSYWQTKYARPDHIPAALCSFDLTRPRMNAIYVGLESMGGVSVHHIRFFVASEDQLKHRDKFEPLISDFHLFVDAHSLVVVKTKTFVFSPEAIENRSDWETYYGDYRPVGGVLMPFHISDYIMGQRVWDISFTSIQPSVSLTPTEFE